MPRDCLITSRVAGPCASCRQPAWPAHVWPDGRILCGNCCPCAPRADAMHAGPDGGRAAAPAAGCPGWRGRAQRCRPGRPAGRGVALPPARGPRYRHGRRGPRRSDAAMAALAGATKPPPMCEPRAADRGPAENMPGIGLPAGAGASPGHGWWGSTGRPDPGPPEALSGPARDLAAPHSLPCRPPRCRPLRGKNISLPECSGYNLMKNWRVT